MAKGKKFQLGLDGLSMTRSDFNDMMAQANAAEDNAYSAIIQPPLYAGVHRYVQPPAAGYLVAPSGTPGQVVIADCTVAVGPLLAGGTTVDTAALASTTYAPAAGTGSSSTARYDLLYATVALDVPASTTTRKVKGVTSKVVSTASVSTNTANVVTVSFVQGAESSTTPVLPTIPSDGAGTYVIALAYIRIPGTFTTSTAIGHGDIFEIAPTLALPSLARPFGGFTSLSSPIADPLAKSSASGQRKRFMPAPMAGKVERYGALSAIAGGPAIGTVLDNSIDWRGRIFKGTVQVNNVSTEAISWVRAASPKHRDA